MPHKVFNEKEQRQRAGSKKHLFRPEGGTGDGPFPRDKLHATSLPFPVLLQPGAILAHPEQSLTPAPSPHQQQVQQSRAEGALSAGAPSKAEAEEAQPGLPCSQEQLWAQAPPARWHEDTQPICRLWPWWRCAVLLFLPVAKGVAGQLQQLRLQRGTGRHSPEPLRPKELPEEMGTPPVLRELPTAADREDPTAVF